MFVKCLAFGLAVGVCFFDAQFGLRPPLNERIIIQANTSECVSGDVIYFSLDDG